MFFDLLWPRPATPAAGSGLTTSRRRSTQAWLAGGTCPASSRWPRQRTRTLRWGTGRTAVTAHIIDTILLLLLIPLLLLLLILVLLFLLLLLVLLFLLLLTILLQLSCSYCYHFSYLTIATLSAHTIAIFHDPTIVTSPAPYFTIATSPPAPTIATPPAARRSGTLKTPATASKVSPASSPAHSTWSLVRGSLTCPEEHP